MWRYKEINTFPMTIEPFRRKREKPIYYYNKESELLESYRTLKEAEGVTGIPVKKLKYLSYNGDLRRKEGRTPITNYWSRIAPTT